MKQSESWQGPAIVQTFSLPKDMIQAIRERARSEDRPISWVARRALVDYLERQRGDAKEKRTDESEAT